MKIVCTYILCFVFYFMDDGVGRMNDQRRLARIRDIECPSCFYVLSARAAAWAMHGL